jgi:hypothetical protein
MPHIKTRLGACALLLFVIASPCRADGSSASSASSAASNSVGSLSDSVKKSSNSSSHGNDNVAEGDYRIIEVTAVAERPGTARVALQAVADASVDGELTLYVSDRLVDQQRLAAGQIVTAYQRPYGVEFAKGETGQAFFLALADEWLRELQTKAVTL